MIANPPYIGEKGHKELFQVVKKGHLGKFYLGKMDYFYFFFHASLNLGKNNSQIAFITTNYYLTAFGAKKLREDFYNRGSIRHLINFNELKIFENALGQHNIITMLSKSDAKNVKAENCITKRAGTANSDILQSILSRHDVLTTYYAVLQDDLYEGDQYYIRLDGSFDQQNQNGTSKILAKIKMNGEPLGCICSVDAGLHPGVDRISEKIHKKYKNLRLELNQGVFVLSHEEARKFKGKGYLKPLYKSSDIQRWKVSTNSYFILYNSPHNEIKDELFTKHISQFRKILEDVRKINNENIQSWKYLRRGVLKEIIYTDIPKIVAPYRSNTNRFAYNTELCYGSQDVYFITENNKYVSLKYVLALLNSNLYFLWLYYRGKRKGEALELYQKPLSEIPIKKIPEDEQKPFIGVVDKILSITKSDDYLTNKSKQAKVREYERQIDQMVYELYSLTKEEIKIVEGDIKEN